MKAKQVQRSSKKGQFSLQAILTVVVGLIVMIVVALPIVQDSVDNATTQTAVTGESINATNDTTQTLANAQDNDLVSGSTTIEESGTTLTAGTNYTENLEAVSITFTNVNNTVFNASNATIDYTYQSEAYVTTGTARTVIDTLPIFVAVGALVLAGAFFFSRR